ncbi:MAG: O-antigen ligase family protein [Rhizobiaceae bacterium]|nr:O-antigen ligase family protein [Rhizobiaceae bacterium]
MKYLGSLKEIIVPLNFWSFGIIATLIVMPPIGSLGCVIIFVMSVVAWKTWIIEEQQVGLTPIENWVRVTICYYFFSALFCSVIKAEQFSDVFLVANNLGLLAGLPLLPILRKNIDETWLDKIVVAMAISSIILVIVSSISLYHDTNNLELFSGNSLILAYLAGFNAIFGLIFFLSHKKFSWLSLAGAISALLVLVLTSRRGPALAVLIAFLPVSILIIRQHFRKVIIFVVCAFMIAGAAAAIWGQAVLKSSRIDHFVESMSAPLETKFSDDSIYIRFIMYRDSWEAFKHAPLLGHGRQNVAKAAAAHSVQENPEYQKTKFTHLHNAFLTEAVASGILGIIGLIGMYLLPIFITWRSTEIIRLMGIGYSVYFFSYGLTNVGFYHDVTVFSYIFTVAILNALAANMPRIRN